MDDEWSDLEIMGNKLHDLVPWTKEQRQARPRVNPIRIAEAMKIRMVAVKKTPNGQLAQILFDHLSKQWLILIRELHNTTNARHYVAHELGEWYMKRTGYAHWNVEYLCDAFAFVLLMPAELLRPRLGGDPWAELPRIAETFDVPVYSVAIRLALLFDRTIAVIDRGEILRVHDWGVETSDEWLRDVEGDYRVRVVEHDRLKVVIKR